jgi:hypothetical protein
MDLARAWFMALACSKPKVSRLMMESRRCLDSGLIATSQSMLEGGEVAEELCGPRDADADLVESGGFA